MNSARIHRLGLTLLLLAFTLCLHAQDGEEGGRFLTEKDWIDWDKAILKPDTVGKLLITEDEGFDITRLKEFKRLRGLILYDYSLEDLRFLADLPKLQILELSGNSLRSLDGIDTLHQLREFMCASNFIRDLSPLDSLRNLRMLKVPDNEIEDISSIAHMTQLLQLDLGGNPIRELGPIAEWQQLKSFSVYRCGQLQDISPIANWTGLEDLNISFLDVPGFSLSMLSGHTHLRSLRVQGMVQSNAELQYIMHLTKLEQLTMGKNDNVTTLDSLRDLVNLKYLDIHANNVKDLYPLQNFPKLIKLVAYRNQITDISPLLNCRELRALFIHGNPIKDYGPLFQMGYIQHLYINKQHFDPNQQNQLKKALRTTNIAFE